jgi:ABC-type Zn uptake system ZnuABC Zn-binding protein ZnuA
MEAPAALGLIVEIEARYDEVLAQLDELDQRVQAVLAQYAPPPVREVVVEEPMPLRKAA